LESTLPLITNDAVVLGILMGILAAIFTTSRSNHPFWKKLYTFVPPLLLCYFLPSVVSTLGIISGEHSQLYFVSSRYLLPTSLVLLTLSVDFGGIVRLGPKAGIMFLVGTLGILLGGPIAILVVSAVDPEVVGGQGADAVWRGMATVAGSWIGGGANQTAMKEIFEVGDDIFSAMIAVDILLEGVWLAVLLYAATRARSIDAWTGADTRAIEELRLRVESYQAEQARIPGLTDTMQVLGVGFSVTAIAHLAAGQIAPWIEREAPGLRVYNLTSSFFWIIIIATTISLVLSNTRLRRLEGVGASRIGSALLYVLIASIGMRMNILAVTESPGLFAVGALWILFHAALLILVAKVIRAPVFFVAVGSEANIGGAASAPVVASAFHPSLAPVGVLLAVLGYGVGTYAAYLCALLMRAVSPA
jgi:uncharacterized membrane protein